MSSFFDFIKKPEPNTSPTLPQGGVMGGNIQQNSNVQQNQSIKPPISNSNPPTGGPVSNVQSPSSTVNPQPSNVSKQNSLDLMTHLTQRSNRVFVTAQTKAKELQSQFVDSEHLLHGLMSDSEIYKLLTDLKIQPQVVEMELVKVYKKGISPAVPQISPRIKRIIDNSLVTARKLGFEFISPEHLLIALYEEGEGVGARVLAKLGLKIEDINKKVLGNKEGLVGQNEKN